MPNCRRMTAVRVTDDRWVPVQTLIRRRVLPYQWEILNDRVEGAEPSYCIHNLRVAAGDIPGEHRGFVFQDSDLYKWLEAVAYSLAIEPDAALLRSAGETIDLISRAQEPDGYLDTYFTIGHQEEKFRNLTEGHELYCAGHLMEAAAAWHAQLGDDRLLGVALKLADCLAKRFLNDDENAMACPGHPEIELALIRLYRITGREQLLTLSRHFLDVRGVGRPWALVERERSGFKPIWNTTGTFDPTYAQMHAPVREQTRAAGHAVRAVYLYSAMADVALLTGDAALEKACRALLDDIAGRQMYVTGGIGSCAIGERFTTDDHLPNDTVYAETCASCGLSMFSSRMAALTGDPRCFDTWERALYNTIMAGMSLDGEHFFYVNPLAIDPAQAAASPDMKHVLPERPRWFGCACCPPNIARTVLSMGQTLWMERDGELWLNSPIASVLDEEGCLAELVRDGDNYTLTADMDARVIRVRIPAGYALGAHDGDAADRFLVIRHPGGRAVYTFTLTPRVMVLHASPRIAADAGKVCVQVGETVYCLEEKDNGSRLCELYMPGGAVLTPCEASGLPEGTLALRCEGFRAVHDDWTDAYREEPARFVPATLTFIPYHLWNNRGIGEMTVWVNQK